MSMTSVRCERLKLGTLVSVKVERQLNSFGRARNIADVDDEYDDIIGIVVGSWEWVDQVRHRRRGREPLYGVDPVSCGGDGYLIFVSPDRDIILAPWGDLDLGMLRAA